MAVLEPTPRPPTLHPPATPLTPPIPPIPPTPLAADDSTLRRLGFRRRHARRLSSFGNFATGFTCIGVLGNGFCGYGYGLAAGGPALALWAWLVGGALTLLVGLALAEVCSALPDAGSLHVYAAKLARRHPRAAAWWVGWLHACGQVALTAAVDLGAAMCAVAFAEIEWNVQAGPGTLYLVLLAILLIQALLVSLGGRERIAALTRISVWWHVFGALALVSVLATAPARTQSPHAVFAHVVNQTGFGAGWSGSVRVYLCALSLLPVAFALTGFDASARAAEETLDGGRSAPRGIAGSIAASWILGFAVLTALTFAIQDLPRESGSPLPAAQVLLDAVGRGVTVPLLVVVLIAQLSCGLACAESSARVLFAVSREGMLPGSGFWYRIDRRTRTPTNAVWLTTLGAAVLCLPVLRDGQTFAALASFAAFASGLAVIIPIYLRLRRSEVSRGPWRLGRLAKPIGWIAAGWTLLVSAALLCPQAYPITARTFDYAPAIPVIALVAAVTRWYRTAHGTELAPLRRGYPDEPGALDAELM